MITWHRKFLESQSTLDEDTPSIAWLLEIIEENSRRDKLLIFENRTPESFKSIFKQYLHVVTTVLTDDDPRLYPSAVSYINGNHIIMNYSIGFKNMGRLVSTIQKIYGT